MKTPSRLTATLNCYKAPALTMQQCDDLVCIQITHDYNEYKQAGGILPEDGYFVAGGLLMDEGLLPLQKIAK